MSIRINNIQAPNLNNSLYSRKPVSFRQAVFQDKVELKNNKQSLSGSAKIGIGIGILSILLLGAELIFSKGKHIKRLSNKLFISSNNQKYMKHIEEIRTDFSKIFGKEYSTEEVKELAAKYKEIFELKDNNEFMKKIWTQLNTDFGLKDIPYSISELENPKMYAAYNLFNGITYNANLIKWTTKEVIQNGITKNEINFAEVDRKHITISLAHELKHAAQDKLACGIDVQKLLNAYIDREQKSNSKAWKSVLAQCNNDAAKARKLLEEKMYDSMIPSYKTQEKIPKDSPMYQKGMEYIDNIRNYISFEDDYSKYKNQLIEKEAFEVGDLFKKIYEWLTEK